MYSRTFCTRLAIILLVIFISLPAAFAQKNKKKTQFTVVIDPGHGGVDPGALGKKAKEKGITISCDLNYRKKLWSREKAGEVMAQLMPYVDVCIANEEDAADVFGIHAAHTDIEGGKLDYAAYESVARQLSQRFGCKKVAITLRSSLSAFDNDWAGMLYTEGQAYFSPTYRIHIVDRVGGGDSFGGGLIYGFMQGFDAQQTIEFAVAASCLKQTIELDVNLSKPNDILALVGGDGSGRVQR